MKSLNKKKKYVVVSIMGGLGDQINQYIFGKYIEKKFNLNVHYDLTYYNHKPQFSFKLNNFKVHEKFKKNIFFPSL